jgi:predicted transcriptional regulator
MGGTLPIMKNMTKISIYLTQEQIQGLVQLATKTHRTNASLIREALDVYLHRHLGGGRRVRRRQAS